MAKVSINAGLFGLLSMTITRIKTPNYICTKASSPLPFPLYYFNVLLVYNIYFFTYQI